MVEATGAEMTTRRRRRDRPRPQAPRYPTPNSRDDCTSGNGSQSAPCAGHGVSIPRLTPNGLRKSTDRRSGRSTGPVTKPS
jgi:hypothetical protein